MKKVYNLKFYVNQYDDYRECFDIGVFRTREEAEEVARCYKIEVKGFCDFRCEREISEVAVVGGDASVLYRAVGWNLNYEGDEIDVVYSEYYASKDEAEIAFDTMKQAFFREEWSLDEYTLGECCWKCGFVRLFNTKGKDGLVESFTIEKARGKDAEAVLEYLRQIGGESDNLSFGEEGLPFGLEAEKKYIESLWGSTNSVMYFAKINGRIVGDASFNSSPRERLRHRGELGMSVLKEYWGQGIGSRLMENVIDFAKNVAGCEIIHLQVRSDNERAIALYKKYGFEKIGQFKGYLKIDGEFVDCDFMNLYLR